jgi:hypothetical protein
MGNDDARKGIFIDLAYAKWTPTDWAQFQVGKMNNDFWFTDMVWDPDYNPEGMQEKLGYDINENHRLNLTAGQFVIQENYNGTGTAANSDVYLFMNQLDWQAKWTKKFSSRAGVALMQEAQTIEREVHVHLSNARRVLGERCLNPSQVLFWTRQTHRPVTARRRAQLISKDRSPWSSSFESGFPRGPGGPRPTRPAPARAR